MIAGRIAAGAASLLVAAVITFVAAETGKEIVFLCGNFTNPGPSTITEDSIRRQFATVEWSSWSIDSTPPGRRHVLDSRRAPARLHCVLIVDEAGRMIEARLRRNAVHARHAASSGHSTDEAGTDPR